MEKLTKQQFRERFADIKVYVDGKSEEIQKQFFKADMEWMDDGKDIDNLDSPFLFTRKDKENIDITHGADMVYFTEKDCRQVSAEEILSVEIIDDEPECPFKPFDKVVVRESDGHVWKAGIFSNFMSDDEIGPYYLCVGSKCYRYCLPYNEQTAKLIGTTNDYKEE